MSIRRWLRRLGVRLGVIDDHRDLLAEWLGVRRLPDHSPGDRDTGSGDRDAGVDALDRTPVR